MHRTLLLSCLAIAALPAPQPASAQEAAPVETVGAVPDAGILGERLAGEKRVRVVTRWGKLVLTDPRLHLQGGGSIDYRRAHLYGLYDPPEDFPAPLPLAEVSAVQLPRRATGQGALIGGAALGAMGMLASLTATRSCDTPGAMLAGCGYDAGDVARTTALSAAAGAAAGAIHGAQTRRWKTVYRTR